MDHVHFIITEKPLARHRIKEVLKENDNIIVNIRKLSFKKTVSGVTCIIVNILLQITSWSIHIKWRTC